MEAGTLKIKQPPPPILEAAATLFMPRSLRNDLIGDLAAGYRSRWQYSQNTLGVLSRVIPEQVRKAFMPGLVLSEIGAVCFAFLGSPFSSGLIGSLALVLLTLSLRDAHTFRRNEPGDPAVDVLMALGLGTMCLVAAAMTLREATSPMLALMRGIAISLPTLLILRSGGEMSRR